MHVAQDWSSAGGKNLNGTQLDEQVQLRLVLSHGRCHVSMSLPTSLSTAELKPHSAVDW